MYHNVIKFLIFLLIFLSLVAMIYRESTTISENKNRFL